MTETASPIRQPLTLDDVSKRIDKICDDYVSDLMRVKGHYDQGLEVLTAEIETSPGLDPDAVGSLVLGRVQRMMTGLAEMAVR